MKFKIFKGKEWEILLKITMTFHHQSKNIFPLCIKIFGVPTPQINTNLKSCPVLNIQTEQNFLLICGFLKDFAVNLTLKFAFY